MKTHFFLLFFFILIFENLSFSQNYNFTDIEKGLSQYSPKNNELINSQADHELLIIEDVSQELSLEGRKPLLLIHGWSFDGEPAQPSGGYWDHFKNYLMNDATLRANFKPYYVKYWSNEVSVQKIGEALRIKIEEDGFNEQKIVIVAHSMGGLVARSYMTEQLFTQGHATGLQCGKLVDRLITLGTPHHGSPMANGPARNDKLNLLMKAYINILEAAVFKEIKYNEVNRNDLWWDNYDGLLNYTDDTNEKNNWLTNLNRNVTFDSKTICYTGSVAGKFNIPESGNTNQEYQLGAWFTEEGFSFQNDGIVPIKSAGFDKHNVKKIRHFNEYNHADIIRGKEDKTVLFDPLKEDMSDVFPLTLTWPVTDELFLKHGKNYDITWETPSTISKLNIYLSNDNGSTFQLIASDVDAQSEKYSWQVPDINANTCLIKITNANFENEQTLSQQTFTIYDNRLTITTPTTADYFVRSKPDTIKWEQVGLGNKVQISYSDTKNSIEKIITQETATSVGLNSFVWDSDKSLLPTDRGAIQIQLLGLNEAYGDDEIYLFTSDTFQVFEDPKFTILSPETNPTDIFDIKGEQFVIGENRLIKWIAKGEIKFIQLFLCDRDKQIIATIGTYSNTPAIEVTGTTHWTIPEFYGDEFYLMSRAGYSIDSITVETYSKNSFRINILSEINNPVDQETAISLQPCFELANVKEATKFEFIVKSTQQQGEKQFRWNYESLSNTFCIPKNIENELLPGTTYLLTARAWLDTIPTYADQATFTTEETVPWDFAIVEPSDGDSVEGNEITIVWTRAVGASSYSIQLFQQDEPISTFETFGSLDTIITTSIQDVTYYEPIEINVNALNTYGEITRSTNFIKKFKTEISRIPASNSQFILTNFPNPFNQATTFEFILPENVSNLQITLFNLTGKRLGIIYEGKLNKGKHQLIWNRELLSGSIPENGTYIYQLKANKITESKLLMIR